MKFSFHNSGSIYFFKPFNIVYDIRESGGKQTALEFHKKLARMLDDPSVFILDNHGKIVALK
jgi:hypothetical protein